MEPLEQEQRAKIVAEARTWMGVPWRHIGRARGGVDCGGFPIVVFQAAGLLDPAFKYPATPDEYYSEDFMFHSDEERFIKVVERFCHRVDRPARDGDIVMFKVGRVAAHCAIVDAWPRVIHSVRKSGQVGYDDANKGELRVRFVGLWTLNAWT